MVQMVRVVILCSLLFLTGSIEAEPSADALEKAWGSVQNSAVPTKMGRLPKGGEGRSGSNGRKRSPKPAADPNCIRRRALQIRF